MSIEWRLGHATTTTASVVVRSSSDGQLTLDCDGSTFTGTDIATSADDGVGLVTATGLSAGRSYAFTATVAGLGSVSGTLKTLPRTGGVLTFGSCELRSITMQLGQLMADADAAVLLGDTPYTNGGSTVWGLAVTDSDSDQSAATFYGHHRSVLLNPGWQAALHVVPSWWMIDDHEFCGDNWDHTQTQAEAGGASFADQAAVDAAFSVANLAWRSYHPDAPFADEDPEKPGEADAGTSASNYPPNYHQFEVGDAEVFVIDCISHKNAIGDPDDASKTLLGSVQKAWLKSALSASSKTYKVIASSKFTHAYTGGNVDGWKSYTTERDELLAYIDSNSITGVVWITGDDHLPLLAVEIQAAGDDYDHLAVNACPFGSAFKTSATMGANTRLIRLGVSGAPDPRCFGRLTFGPDYLTAEIVDWRGSVMWAGRVAAGSNALTYPRTRVA